MNSHDTREKTELDARYERLREIINRRYSIEQLIAKYDPSVTSQPKSIVSILNVNDSNPSMYPNYKKNVWKCFSSGKGGGYLELLYWLKVLREQEKNVEIRKLANGILISDKEIQKEFGATSLFKHELPKVIEPKLRNPTVSRAGTVTISSVIKNLAAKEDKELLFKFISDYEMGMPVKELVEKYEMYNTTTKETSESKSFGDFITNMFGGNNDV